MKKTIFLILLFALIISASAFADYKIILKNGREFVVEEYKESGDKIKFFRGGGEIELDKASIKDIKKVKAPKTTEGTDASGIVRYDQTEKQTPEGKENAAKAKGVKSAAAEGRLKEIATKKEQMKTEGEKLSAEKKKLEEDIKKEGRVLNIRKEREYKQRISEIEGKIKKYNQEISQLNTEEATLLLEIGGQQKK